jgi:lactoylglutathione lyase
MQITELNHIALFVSSVDVSARFYREALGLPVIPRPDFSFPGAWFRIGARQELHLIGDRLHAPVTEVSRSGHFAMQVKDIAAAAAHLRERGVVFRGPAPRPDGALQIFLEDPDGHLVEFCTAP